MSPAILARIAALSDTRTQAQFSGVSQATTFIKPKLTRLQQQLQSAIEKADEMADEIEKNFYETDSRNWPRNPFEALRFFAEQPKRREAAIQQARQPVEVARNLVRQEEQTQERANEIARRLAESPGSFVLIKDAIAMLFYLGRRNEGREMLAQLKKLDPVLGRQLNDLFTHQRTLDAPDSLPSEDIRFTIPESASPAALAAVVQHRNEIMQAQASYIQRLLRPGDAGSLEGAVHMLFRLGRREEGRRLHARLSQLAPQLANVVRFRRSDFNFADDDQFKDIHFEVPPDI